MNPMNIRYTALSLALLLGLCAPTLEAQTLSLDEARAIALEHSHELARARNTTAGATQRLKAARTYYLPQLKLSGYGYYAPPSDYSIDLGRAELPADLRATLSAIGMAHPQLGAVLSQMPTSFALPPLGLSVATGPSFVASITADQPIYMGGKISAAHEMSRRGLAIARLSEGLSVDKVYLQTDEAYWTLVETQRLAQTAQAYSDAIEEAYRVVDNAVRTGMRTRADLLRVEVERSNAQLQTERARGGIRLARQNLCRILGLPLTTDIAPRDTVVGLYDLALGDEPDLSSRFEYQILEEQVRLRRAGVRLTRSEYLPQVGLRAGYSYMRGVEVNDRLLFDRAQPSILLSVSVPIFSWGQGTAKVRQARTELQDAELQLAEASQSMRLEQEATRQHYTEAQLEVHLMAKTLEQARELRRQAHNRYQAGLDTTAEWLAVEALLSKAESDYIRANTRLAVAHTKLLKALGRLAPAQ